MSSKQALTHVAVGIVHNAAGQVLFAQRPPGKPYAGWWEFPGGKIETDESLPLALARELREELGIQILDCHHWLTQRFVYPHAHVNLQFCHVEGFSGQPQSLEGQAFAWGTPDSPPLPFLPAALPVLKAMQLPSMLSFTAAGELSFDIWLASLARKKEGFVIIHEATDDQAQRVLNACMAWKTAAPRARSVLMSSQHPRHWWGLADGVFLLDDALVSLTERPSCHWVGAQVSNLPTMQAASALGCDFQIIAADSGWGTLGEVLNGCELASYASGDHLQAYHLPLAQAAGAAGLALMHPAWL